MSGSITIDPGFLGRLRPMNPCGEVVLDPEPYDEKALQYVVRLAGAKDYLPVFVAVNKTWGWLGQCPVCKAVGKAGQPCFSCPRSCHYCKDPRPCQHELQERARQLLGTRGAVEKGTYNYLRPDGVVCNSIEVADHTWSIRGYQRKSRCGAIIEVPDYTSMPVTCLSCLAL